MVVVPVVVFRIVTFIIFTLEVLLAGSSDIAVDDEVLVEVVIVVRSLDTELSNVNNDSVISDNC